MHENEIKIIKLLRENEKEMSTSEIVKEIYKNEFNKIKKESESLFDDKKKEEEFKRSKAKLHRKTLYHLNKLIEKEILEISKITGKNQKHFLLKINEEEDIIIEHKRKKLIISKPNLPAMPIEGYEQKDLIKKYEEATWISRTNSVMLQAKRIETIEKLSEIILESFSYINDTIGINDFEIIIEKTTEDKLNLFFEKIEQECSDYGKTLSITIDFSNIKDPEKIKNTLVNFSERRLNSINIIFDVTLKEIQKYEEIFKNIITSFSKSKTQLFIKNQEAHDAPYMLGKTGPYTFREEEWKLYKEEFKNKIPSILCSQTTVLVDMEKYFKLNQNSFQFRQFVLNIAKSLLYANSIQRNRSNEYLKYFINLNEPYIEKLFSYSRSYIRFWNYGWKKIDKEPNLIIDLLKSTKEVIDEFCTSEETIYKACGMPTRFKIAFSCAFKEAKKENFSEEKFKKIKIKKMEDLYSDEIKEILSEKEKIFKIFDGGDRLRLYRSTNFEPKDIIREIRILLNSFQIPFFCYDFGELNQEDMSLNTFIEK